MRRIYKAEQDEMAVAWIGESAPVPDGWHLDINKATQSVIPESFNVVSEELPLDPIAPAIVPEMPVLIDDMTKNQIKKYMWDMFGLVIDKRKSIDRLRAEAKSAEKDRA